MKSSLNGQLSVLLISIAALAAKKPAARPPAPSRKLFGPPKEIKANSLYGGYMNVKLPKEGAPIYIDQNPSYIYKDPKTPYNQNGMRLPLTQPFIRPQPNDMVSASFVRPLPEQPKAGMQRGLGQALNKFNVNNVQSSYEPPNYEENIDPSGLVVSTKILPTPPETNFESEGLTQLSNHFNIKRKMTKTRKLLKSFDDKFSRLKTVMGHKEARLDGLIDDIIDSS